MILIVHSVRKVGRRNRRGSLKSDGRQENSIGEIAVDGVLAEQLVVISREDFVCGAVRTLRV